MIRIRIIVIITIRIIVIITIRIRIIIRTRTRTRTRMRPIIRNRITVTTVIRIRVIIETIISGTQASSRKLWENMLEIPPALWQILLGYQEKEDHHTDVTSRHVAVRSPSFQQNSVVIERIYFLITKQQYGSWRMI